jgi:hypothetical protein
MAGSMVFLILGLLILLGIIAIVFARKGKRKPTDYYSFFIIGISWLPFGILIKIMNPDLFLGTLFIMLGFIYLVMGLAHKKEWKKNHKSWKQLSGKERRIKLIATVVLGILFLAAIVIFYLTKRGIF